MTLTKSIAMAVIVVALGVGGSQTQAQDSRSQPAEFPPSSYKGKQYVDSAGCVFIRAGIDGNVSWVPRMSRAREQVCGFQPTGGVPVAAGPSGQSRVSGEDHGRSRARQETPGPRCRGACGQGKSPRGPARTAKSSAPRGAGPGSHIRAQSRARDRSAPCPRRAKQTRRLGRSGTGWFCHRLSRRFASVAALHAAWRWL